MAIPSLELQKAIYGLLSTKYKVYDFVPNSPIYPFIQIGDETITLDDTKTNRRTVHNVTLHTWAKGSSSVGAKQLNHFVIESILNDLVVDFFDVHFITLVMLTTLQEVEVSEIYHHGVLQFEITLMERI